MAQEAKEDQAITSGNTATLEYNCYKQFLDQYSQNTADYDIKLPFQRHYVGPIEFSRTENRGRSWIAKQNISKGTLLLAEKAYIFSSRNHNIYLQQYIENLNQQSSNTSNTSNASNNANINGDNEEDIKFDETVLLISKLIDLLLNHPNPSCIVKDLKALYPRETEMEDFETFHLSDFDITNNQDKWLFNHSMLKLENHLAHTKNALQKFDITLNQRTLFCKRIPWIIYHNAMIIKQNIELLCYDGLFSDSISDALFIKSSFFNHNCNPNCIRIFIGDIVIVRAIKDIKTKEECCFSYIANEYLSENYRIRNFQLPFECLCDKCITERTQHFNLQTQTANSNDNNNTSFTFSDNDAPPTTGSGSGTGTTTQTDECKDIVCSPNSAANRSNISLDSRGRIESDYDSEAEGQEMTHYEEHRIFINDIAARLFSLKNVKERIDEINKLLGINSNTKEKSMKEIELSVSSRKDLNIFNKNNDSVDHIVHRDFLEAYTAKAMSFCELNDWEMAFHCWDLCLNDVTSVQGFYNENSIVYATQCLLCYCAIIHTLRNENIDSNKDSISNLEQKKIKIVKRYVKYSSNMFWQ